MVIKKFASQILEGKLRGFVTDFYGNWDIHLPLVEFSYNNTCHRTISAPFESLNSRSC